MHPGVSCPLWVGAVGWLEEETSSSLTGKQSIAVVADGGGSTPQLVGNRGHLSTV